MVGERGPASPLLPLAPVTCFEDDVCKNNEFGANFVCKIIGASQILVTAWVSVCLFVRLFVCLAYCLP